LKDPSLREIEQKDLGISILISWVLSSHIASGFKNHKATITADASSERLACRITDLSDDRIGL